MAVLRILGIDPGLRTTGFGVDRVRRARACTTSPAARSAAIRALPGPLPARLKVIFDGVRELSVRYQPHLRLGRDRLRQRQPAVDAAARPGARRGADGAGVERSRGGRVHRAADEEGDRRPRPGEEGAGAGDGDAPARPARPAGQGRRRRARPGDLPRPCGALLRRDRAAATLARAERTSWPQYKRGRMLLRGQRPADRALAARTGAGHWATIDAPCTPSSKTPESSTPAV